MFIQNLTAWKYTQTVVSVCSSFPHISTTFFIHPYWQFCSFRILHYTTNRLPHVMEVFLKYQPKVIQLPSIDGNDVDITRIWPLWNVIGIGWAWKCARDFYSRIQNKELARISEIHWQQWMLEHSCIHNNIINKKQKRRKWKNMYTLYSYWEDFMPFSQSQSI